MWIRIMYSIKMYENFERSGIRTYASWKTSKCFWPLSYAYFNMLCWNFYMLHITYYKSANILNNLTAPVNSSSEHIEWMWQWGVEFRCLTRNSSKKAESRRRSVLTIGSHSFCSSLGLPIFGIKRETDKKYLVNWN